MQVVDARRLLARVAGVYERYGSSDEEDFNIFSVLRTASDEVNLHSRFLAAVLRENWMATPVWMTGGHIPNGNVGRSTSSIPRDTIWKCWRTTKPEPSMSAKSWTV